MAEERVQRRLAAILAADVVGYSRLMGKDESGTLSRLRTLRSEVFDPKTEQFGGRIFKTTGDGAFAEFGSAVDAVQCSVEIQRELAQRNADATEDQRMVIRIGISVGDVVVDGDDLFGSGVNIAARMEGLADAGGICVSGNVQEQMANTLKVAVEDLGEQSVKNIDRPIRCYRVHLDTKTGINTPAPMSDKPALAVLPFENISGDPEQEYFADGLTEDITTALSLSRLFPVIARNSSFVFKGNSPDIREVGKTLGARYVLEGSVRKAGERVRISAQLIDATTGHHVWADRYDREFRDLFAVQDEITQRIGAIIEPAIADKERKRLTKKSPQDMDAWDLCIQGSNLIDQGTKEANQLAREKFQRAIELDPEYSRAWSGLAYTHSRDIRLRFTNSREESLKEVFRAARRAVELDEFDSEARLFLGRAYNMSRQPENCFAELRRAVELNPQDTTALWSLGSILYINGPENAEEGIPMIEKALEINPLDPRNYVVVTHLAAANLCVGNYEKAVELARSAGRQRPDYVDARATLAAALGYLDRFDDAQKEAGEFKDQVWDFATNHLILCDETKKCYLMGLEKAGFAPNLPPPDAPLSLPDKPSIAVLPFDNMSADPEQEYFSDGITEDIITELSKISGLFVIARHSAFTYKGRSVTLKQVGKELGVRYALEGSVRKAGNRLRITAQLIDADSDQHLWAERYDRDIADIFAVQEEVARHVAEALTVTLNPAELDRLAHAPTENLEAYELYKRARPRTWPPTQDNILSARNAYTKVIEVDGMYAGGYAGKSMTHSLAVLFGYSEDRDGEAQIAMDLANRAIAIDPKFARSYSALGSALSALGRHEEAIAASRSAIELQPGDADSHEIHGRCLMFAGAGTEACDEIRTALRLDPQYVEGPYLNFLGRASFIASKYVDTIATFEQNLARGGPLSPPTPPARAAAACALVGRMDDARRILDDYVLRFDPKLTLKKLEDQILARINIGDEVERLVDGLRKAGLPE